MDDENTETESLEPTESRSLLFSALGIPADENDQPPVPPADDEPDDGSDASDEAGENDDDTADDAGENSATDDYEDGFDIDEAEDDSEEEDEEEEQSDDDDGLGEAELEQMRKDESHAIKKAREEGRRRKEVEREKQSLEERNVELSRELDEARAELEKHTFTRIDPTTHPDFVAAKKKTHSLIIAAIDDEIGLDAAEIFERQGWGDELTAASQMVDATVAERRKIKEPLRLSIAKKLNLVPSDTTVLDPSIDGDAISTADKVIAVMSRHTGQYDKLSDIYANIQTKAENKNLEVGFREYSATTKPIRESILTIAAMSDKDIEEDPNSLQALAAKKIKASPEAKSKFDMITKAVIEMAFGPESLSQEDLDRHAKAGKDMSEFHKNRERRVKEFREKRLPEIAAAMMLWPDIKKALPEYFKKVKEENSRKDKKAVVRKTAGKPAPTRIKPAEEDSVDAIRENIRKSLKLG